MIFFGWTLERTFYFLDIFWGVSDKKNHSIVLLVFRQNIYDRRTIRSKAFLPCPMVLKPSPFLTVFQGEKRDREAHTRTRFHHETKIISAVEMPRWQMIIATNDRKFCIRSTPKKRDIHHRLNHLDIVLFSLDREREEHSL